MKTKPRKTKPTPEETEKPIFRDPTPQEIAEAWQSVSAWVYDEKNRDMELCDYWQEHCIEFAVAAFQKASAN